MSSDPNAVEKCIKKNLRYLYIQNEWEIK